MRIPQLASLSVLALPGRSWWPPTVSNPVPTPPGRARRLSTFPFTDRHQPILTGQTFPTHFRASHTAFKEVTLRGSNR